MDRVRYEEKRQEEERDGSQAVFMTPPLSFFLFSSCFITPRGGRRGRGP